MCLCAAGPARYLIDKGWAGKSVLLTQGATSTLVIAYAMMAQGAAGGTGERLGSEDVAPKKKERSWTKTALSV